MTRSVWVVVVGIALSGCGTPMHAEMLGESIKVFGGKIKPGAEKVWITGPADSACDHGCPSALCGGKPEKGGTGGALFGGGAKAEGAGPWDRLAYEVFTNYLTQKHKMRVVEHHRHNYFTEANVETRKKIDFLNEQGKTISTMSCEDLCLLDEAKKRKADKVLAFRILEMSNEEMKINFRLSDVPSGVVEASQTIKVVGLHAWDASPPFQSRAAAAAAAAAAAGGGD